MPPSKEYVKTKFPRICDICGYSANNFSMWYYHNNTHKEIPKGQLCDNGCGLPAIIIGTNAKFRCNKIAQKCPVYIKEQSERIKRQWNGNDIRKKKAREIFLEVCVNNEEVREKCYAKMKEKSKILNDQMAKDFRSYARRCRKLSQQWAKSQGIILGQLTLHVDHKLSVWDGFHAKIPPSLLSNPVNLQILSANDNSRKGHRSSITIEELLNLLGIDDYEKYDFRNIKRDYTKTDETRKKLSAANKGKKLSEETKSKMSASQRGRKVSDETKHKLSMANKGRKFSDKTLEKMSLAQLGKKHSKETREKMSNLRLGRTHSKECREKMSMAQKGKQVSQETKQKISDAHKGLVCNDETRQKISIANTGKIWITNGLENKFIMPPAIMPDGFWRGKSKKEANEN